MALYESSKIMGVSAYGCGDSENGIVQSGNTQLFSLTIPANGKYSILFGGTTNKTGGADIFIEYFGIDGNVRRHGVIANKVSSSSDLGIIQFEDYLIVDPPFSYIYVYTPDATSSIWVSGFLSITQIE